MPLARYIKGHEIMAANGDYGLKLTSTWQAGKYQPLHVESITRGYCNCKSVPIGMLSSNVQQQNQQDCGRPTTGDHDPNRSTMMAPSVATTKQKE